jgi:hypothetical protein
LWGQLDGTVTEVGITCIRLRTAVGMLSNPDSAVLTPLSDRPAPDPSQPVT